jgi:hypothetical protein
VSLSLLDRSMLKDMYPLPMLKHSPPLTTRILTGICAISSTPPTNSPHQRVGFELTWQRCCDVNA